MRENFVCEDEKMLSEGLRRLIHLNSPTLLKFMLNLMEGFSLDKDYSWDLDERTMILMIHYTLWQKPLPEVGMGSIMDSISRLYNNKELFNEVISIFRYNYNNLSINPIKDNLGYISPLEVHCTYSTKQILAALGKHTESYLYPFREGVLYIEEKKTDLLFITLNKVEKHYSPSTMYKDYAINDKLFHWQTQSTIGPNSDTCKRYINHKSTGNKILLFVRENEKDNGATSPFVYLGKADYVSHRGSKPVNIVWKLHNELPPGMAVKAEKAL